MTIINRMDFESSKFNVDGLLYRSPMVLDHLAKLMVVEHLEATLDFYRARKDGSLLSKAELEQELDLAGHDTVPFAEDFGRDLAAKLEKAIMALKVKTTVRSITYDEHGHLLNVDINVNIDSPHNR